MKRNLFKSLCLSGLAAAAVLTVSCEPEGPDNNPPGTNRFIVTETVTPLRYTDMKYYAGSEGVSIEVTDKATQNFTFVLKPGEDVQSYRLQVYPVSALYNTLLNVLNEEKAQSYTVEKVEELIANMISNTQSETSGGILFTPNDHGDEYYDMEFDWMNSTYAKIDIKPKADYLIVVQAYFDDKGTELPADLCICHVKTPSEPVIGNPQVELDVMTGFTGYSVTHKPNEDTYGFYYLSVESEQIDNYIDKYGEEMFSQFLRHYGGLVETSEENYVLNASDRLHDVWYCATAIAIDKNMTPADEVNRKDFQLNNVPLDATKAEGKVELPHKVSATVCVFKVRLEANAYRLAYCVHPAAEADRIMAMPDAERKFIAENMVRGMSDKNYPGWIVVNPNYKLDTDKNEVYGDPFETIGWQHELAGNAEYKIVWSMMNGYGQATDLFCTEETFTTDTWVLDNPSACEAKATMSVSESNRTALTINSKFNSDNTARIWWQYYYPDNPGSGYDLPDPVEIIRADPERKDEFELWDPAGDDARYGRGKYEADPNAINKKDWLFWFFEWRDPGYGFPWPNEVVDGYLDNQEVDDYGYFDGFEPDTEVYFAYMVEDWNGVVGPVQFFKGMTRAITPGPDPTATIEAKEKSDGGYEAVITCNEDTKEMKYAAAKMSDNSSLGLMLNYLIRPDFGGVDYQGYIDAWTEYVLGTGLSTQSLKSSIDLELDDEITVAFVLPIGEENGKNKNGKLQTIVWTKESGKFQSLEEYMGVAVE